MENIKTEEFILLGYSGHGLVVAEAILSLRKLIHGYHESEEKKFNPFNLKFIGDDRSIDFTFSSNKRYAMGVGDNSVREFLFNRIKNDGGHLANIYHPSSSISQYNKIGEGTFIGRSATLNPFSIIGRGVVINTSASIDHECEIGDFSHIAPGAVIAGGVKIGKRVIIGANSVIKEGILIDDDAIIGAGAVVIKDVQKNTINVGNPARIKI